MMIKRIKETSEDSPPNGWNRLSGGSYNDINSENTWFLPDKTFHVFETGMEESLYDESKN